MTRLTRALAAAGMAWLAGDAGALPPARGDTRLMVGPPPGVTLAEPGIGIEAPTGNEMGMLPAGGQAPDEEAEPGPALPRGAVEVDPATVLQNIRGFGGQADYQLLGAPGKADGVTAQDYDYVISQCLANGFAWARVGLPAWEDRNDDDSPDTVDAGYFDEQFAYHYPGLVEHLRGLKAAGIEPILVMWGFPVWMYGADGKLLPGMLPEVVENCAVLLGALAARGVPVRWFTIVNEPPWGRSIGDPEAFAEAVALLGGRLKEMKLEVHIVAPDISGDILHLAGGWVEPLLRRAPEYVNVIALHGYQFSMDAKPSDLVAFHGALRRQVANRGAGGRTPEIWYTEYNGHWFGNADEDRRADGGPCDRWAHGIRMAELTHWLLTSGVSLPMVWELYDVRRAVEEESPKRWGTMKYKTEQWVKRPEYWTVGMYSRFIKPGFRMVKCRTSSAGGPLAVAATGPGELVLVLVNPAARSDSADVAIGVEPEGATAEVWETTRESPNVVSFRPVRDGRVWVDLPPMSVVSVRIPLKR